MKKVVQDLTSGGIDWQREKWQSGLGSKFIHQGEKNAAKYADEVIVLSKGVQDYVKKEKRDEEGCYKINFDHKTRKLTAQKIDKLNVFSEPKIQNLTAIIGENGVGKTTLINYLTELGDVPYTQKSFGSTAGKTVKAWHGVRYCWH